MALSLADRFLTIVTTATLTSAAWIVGGSGLLVQHAPRTPTVATTAAPVAPIVHPAPIAKQEVASSGDLVIPVSGVSAGQLVDTFSDARGGGARLHEALDIMAPAGTPVVAAAAGKVEKLFLSAAGGNTIYVRSPDRQTIYYYAHLQSYQPGLAEGQEVGRGQQLGLVGSTGNADPAAPHLHFAIMRTTQEAQWWDPATAIDPYPELTGRSPIAPKT